jgi:hypothetical protein
MSLAWPRAHWSVSEALISRRYSLSLAVPVRSWANMLALAHLKLLYKGHVCFPGRAVSSFLVYTPTLLICLLCCLCFLLELQLRGSATDPTDTLRILLLLYGSYGSFTDPLILWLKLELQLVGNRVIGIKIYRALMPTSVGKQLKQFNLFYAAHISLLLL